MSETTMTATQSQSLADAVWGDTPPATATVETTEKVEQQQAAAPATDTPTQTAPVIETQKEEFETVDADKYLRDNLGYSSWEDAKKEIEDLRKLKDTPQNQFKFENEQSQKLFDAIKAGEEEKVFEYLNTKKQIDRVEKLNVNDPKEASEIIKLNLRLKYAELDDFEVADQFRELYEKPDKPKQGVTEDEDDYNDRVSAWQVRCDAIDKKIVRDAKIMKPELSQATQKIVLPDIKGNQVSPEPSQEDLAAQKAYTESFLKSAQSAVVALNEFSASVKDKDVDFTVGYGFSQDEKTFVQQQMQNFAEKNFDANALFSSRWLNEDGSINSGQMAKDLSLLFNGDKISSKLVQEASSKRLELYLKGKKNIQIGNDVRGEFNPTNEDRTEAQNLQAWVWGA